MWQHKGKHGFPSNPPIPLFPRLPPLPLFPRFPLQGLDVLHFLRGWVPFPLPAFVAMWGEYGRDARYRPGPLQARPPSRLSAFSGCCCYRPQPLALSGATFRSRLFGVSRAAGGFRATNRRIGRNTAWGIGRRQGIY